MASFGPSQHKQLDWRLDSDNKLQGRIDRVRKFLTDHPEQREKLQPELSKYEAELERRQQEATDNPKAGESKAWLGRVCSCFPLPPFSCRSSHTITCSNPAQPEREQCSGNEALLIASSMQPFLLAHRHSTTCMEGPKTTSPTWRRHMPSLRWALSSATPPWLRDLCCVCCCPCT